MTNQQVKVARAILSTSDLILLKAGFAAYADESLAGNYVLVYFDSGELTISDSLSQSDHPDCIAFPTFCNEAVLSWADLDEGEEVEMETLITIYVWDVYAPEQRRRLEAMLEAATA